MDRKKKILLLGGFGFLGTNILKYVDTYLIMQYDCIVFDKFDRHPNDVQFACLKKTYAGDFSDSLLINCIFKENKIDVVLHALSTTVPVDSMNAQYDVQSNLIPTIHILDNMVKYNVQSIIYISSGGAIYGNQNHDLYSENLDVFPISSYGVVKLAIEKYIMQYAQQFALKPLIVRLSNPYGKYHYSMKQGVVNVAIQKALQNEVLQIWGDGLGKKDYIYVEDFVDILFRLLHHPNGVGVINIGSGYIFSVNEIVKTIRHEVLLEVCYTNSKRLDVEHFELDISKLKALIGEYSFTTLEDGIKKTIEWVRKKCD